MLSSVRNGTQIFCSGFERGFAKSRQALQGTESRHMTALSSADCIALIRAVPYNTATTPLRRALRMFAATTYAEPGTRSQRYYELKVLRFMKRPLVVGPFRIKSDGKHLAFVRKGVAKGRNR